MGYYTKFSLKIGGDEGGVVHSLTIIKELREQDRPEYDYQEWGAVNGLREDGSTGDPEKWTYHEKHLESLSQKYPRMVFTLRGEEENGNIWEKHFQNGWFVKVLLVGPDFAYYCREQKITTTEETEEGPDLMEEQLRELDEREFGEFTLRYSQAWSTGH